MTNSVIQLLTSWLDLSEVDRPVFIQTRQLDVPSSDDFATQTKSDAATHFMRQHERMRFMERPKNFSETFDESKLVSSEINILSFDIIFNLLFQRSVGLHGKNSKSGRCISVVNETSASLAVDNLKVGLQNYLQYLFRSLSVVFYIQHKTETSPEVHVRF